MSFPASDVYVISGNLLSATATAGDPAVFEDFLHSNLLSQLSTDKTMGSRFDNPALWLDTYRNTLGKLFWNMRRQGVSDYIPKPAIQKITLLEILENTFLKDLTQDQKDRIIESIALFDALPDENPANVLYNLNTHAALGAPKKIKPLAVSALNLQVSVVYGNNKIANCGIYFQTTQAIEDKIFSQEFIIKDLQSNISLKSFDAALIEASYAKIRQSVIEKLGPENIQANIVPVAPEAVPVPPLTPAETRRFIEAMEI